MPRDRRRYAVVLTRKRTLHGVSPNFDMKWFQTGPECALQFSENVKELCQRVKYASSWQYCARREKSHEIFVGTFLSETILQLLV